MQALRRLYGRIGRHDLRIDGPDYLPRRIGAARLRLLSRPHDTFVRSDAKMISQKAKYALKALLALGRAVPGRPSSIRDIAAREQIPQSFLEQILIELRRAGLVESRRGKDGGYLLAAPASAIGLGRVLRIVDGPLAPLPCLSRTAYRRCADCPDEAACTVRAIFLEMYETTVSVMDRTTLADALVSAAPATGQNR